MVRLFESPGRSVAPVERGKVERLLPCTEGALSVLADIREYIIINTFFMKASYSSKKGVARNLLFFLLLFFMLPSMAIAQSTVRGIVTDDNGEPLPGVAVVKDGTSLAVSTDIDGRFAIKASEGDVLKFSYVGMESKTVKVGKENELNVKLSSSLTELDEVIPVKRRVVV